MLIFFILFLVTNKVANTVFNIFILNSNNIYSLLSIIIFATIALTIIDRFRKRAFKLIFILIIIYSLLGMIFPYKVIICMLIATIVSVFGTYTIKKHIFKFIKQNEGKYKLEVWQKWLIKII